ncbi:hypothetical protein PFDSM3638_04635 [Pyrococcus furiosus DSM 3638]|uniref:Uncharacterized protein n=3 Tax=Pyrococcus furiosus TaxID=2261 RepID=A0A5C0XPG6_PYRFU|nr:MULTISPECIES: hypothetical protein [Pyrococcus]AAL81050.1 hypothetical protein PF0926 [Pyrococcus furiosus DSM 3638]AFN03719.1 hypothetical protein PFC_03850 [Pyrococcus furiosus COM1]MDK2869733.1 hypothetical protein [Pyrococcus sp.]QEK78592.1 hypothetical protein PFDSM3638_04635 [Pyrococcus furiosus DSM 3638]
MEYIPPVGGDIGIPADTFFGVNDVFGVNWGAILNAVGYAYFAAVWVAVAAILVAIKVAKEIFELYDPRKLGVKGV